MITQSLVAPGEALLEIDHMFVCVDAEPNPQDFARLGLFCSDRVIRRAEQGTASRLVFFDNIYLEFVWVEDAKQSEIYAMRSGIDYVARSQWMLSRCCPLGIALRQNDAEIGIGSGPIELAEHAVNPLVRLEASNLVAQWEPFCYMIPPEIALVSLFARSGNLRYQVTDHPLGIRSLTQASVAIEHSGPLTPPMTMLSDDGIVELAQNQSFELILTFDAYRQKQCLSLASLGIPVILRY